MENNKHEEFLKLLVAELPDVRLMEFQSVAWKHCGE